MQNTLSTKPNLDTLEIPHSEIINVDVNDVKEQLGINLNSTEITALNAWRQAHLSRFIELCRTGGIAKAKESYSVGRFIFTEGHSYGVRLLNSDKSDFNCEFEFANNAATPQIPVLKDFRITSYVTTLEGEKIILSMCNTEDGKVKYEVQEYAEG